MASANVDTSSEVRNDAPHPLGVYDPTSPHYDQARLDALQYRAAVILSDNGFTGIEIGAILNIDPTFIRF